MKSEYDFFQRRERKVLPQESRFASAHDLDAKLQEQLERLAEKTGKDVGEMVNQLVRKEMEVIEEFT